jgi:hypothetical protein
MQANSEETRNTFRDPDSEGGTNLVSGPVVTDTAHPYTIVKVRTAPVTNARSQVQPLSLSCDGRAGASEDDLLERSNKGELVAISTGSTSGAGPVCPAGWFEWFGFSVLALELKDIFTIDQVWHKSGKAS